MKTLLHLLLFGTLFALTPAYSATVTGRSAKTTLDGSEELPINDAGVDKKVTVANLLLAPQGAMTATSVNGLTITTTTGTLTVTNAKTLGVSNSLTLAGTDGDTVTFPAGGGNIVTTDAAQTLLSKTLTAPTLTAPVLGVATATSLNGLTVTTSTGTLTVSNGKTLAASNTLTLAGTDGTTMTFPSGSGTVVTADSTVTMTNKTLTSPTLTTPTLGVASATSINKVALTAPASSATLTISDGKTLAATATLTLSGTDSTVMTFPGTSQTIVGLTSTQTLTNKTLTAPTLTAPVLGVATATSLNGLTIDTTTGTFTLTNGKTLAVSNSLTLAGTDSTTFTFPPTTNTVMTSSLASNDVAAANGVWGASNALVFEGSSADGNETTLTATNPTAARTVTFADGSGTVMLSSLATNAPNAANSVTGASNALIFEGTANASDITLTAADATAAVFYILPNAAAATYALMSSVLTTNSPEAANSVTGTSNGLIFEGTANTSEITLTAADATADVLYQLPDAPNGTYPVTANVVEARTVTAAGLTTGTISAGVTHVTVTSDDANKILILPAPVVGHQICIHGPATGFELRSSAPASIAINAGTGADAESAIPANATLFLTCVTSTAWKGYYMDADGDVAKIEAAAP